MKWFLRQLWSFLTRRRAADRPDNGSEGAIDDDLLDAWLDEDEIDASGL